MKIQQEITDLKAVIQERDSTILKLYQQLQSVTWQLHQLEKLPNEETLKVIRETEEGLNIVRCKDADALFKDLNI
jgi:predicted nucleic acid-binding OB-fold protein